jgi:hypothetical protein
LVLNITQSQKENDCEECTFAFSAIPDVEIEIEEDCALDTNLLSEETLYFGYAVNQSYKKKDTLWVESGWAKWTEEDNYLEFFIED